MKLNELKHNHSLTDLLKVILFACLMLTPIMSVIVRSLYVVCNKNAKDSYYGETINEQINTQISITELENNKDYLFSNEIITSANAVSFNIYPINNKVIWNNTEITNVSYISFYYGGNDGTTPYMATRLVGASGNSNHTNLSSNVLNVYFTFDYMTGYNVPNDNPVLHDFYEVSYNKYSYLDNVFDYSISQIEQSQYYNWTQNTAIYTGVTAMTTGLGITGATIPILITYWFLLTVIYIVIDIILNLFTYLTHFLNKKAD